MSEKSETPYHGEDGQTSNPTDPTDEPSNEGAFQYLPSRAYTDDDLFELEIDSLFPQTWQYLGGVSEVPEPGDYVTRSVGNKELILIRDEEGDLRAFYNVCPHRGSKVLDGEGSTGRIQCPYHAWTFNTCGELESAPNFDQDELDYDEYGLESLTVETRGPFVFVTEDPDPVPLSNVVGPVLDPLDEDYGLDDLELIESETYEMHANWKAVVENFLECDHCASNHHDFVRIQDINNYSGEYHDYCSLFHAPIRDVDTDLFETPIEDWEAAEGRYYFVWPNLTINVFPGPMKHLNIMHWHPVSPDLTIAKFDYYFTDDEITDDKQNLLDFIDQVQKEDMELCSRQHEGLSTNVLENGVLAPGEKGIKHFHSLVRDFHEDF